MVYQEDETTGSFIASPKSVRGEKRPVLVALTGNSAGRCRRVDGSSCVIGRSADADFLLDEEGISRKHARVLIDPDGKMKIKDLKSTNGTFVNDERIELKELVPGDKIRLGANTVIRFAMEDDVEANVRKQLFSSATQDPLTGIQNKRAFDDHALRHVAYSRRHQSPLALVMIDIDHFKRVNDTYGHPVGDEVIQCVASRLLEAVRVEDTVCRVGGEEFAVLLPGIDFENGLLAADRFRTVVARDPIQTAAGPLDVSISLGVALYDAEKHETVKDLVSDADTQLYAAKHQGRNCVRPEPPRRRRVFRDLKTVVNDDEIRQYAEIAKQMQKK